MARFSEIEIKLLNKYLRKTRLYTSLALIREAMEDIWDFDTPRIIQGFTDHGEKHSERLVCSVDQLINLNDGKNFSKKEIYLLFAGIYLHDIGMQCDVVKFPEVKEKAEELGANFAVDFTAKDANNYSIEEQKAIRINHNYLSAAWIDYAFNSTKTFMQLAVKSIPETLIDDLMDVCMFHSKLPIINCANNFTIDQMGRKRLIAALLRLSDELDIDAKRVNIKTVKNFSINPQNSVFWWLHNSTQIRFINKNMIHLIIRLHPKDAKEHGFIIKKTFIDEFHSKNLPVLRVLEREKIPIEISKDSGILEYDRSDRLPSEIIEELYKIEHGDNSLAKITRKVQSCLQTLKYELSEPKQIDFRTMDILATLESGIFKQRVLVRCIDGEIKQVDIEQLNSILNQKIPQGMLISKESFSDRLSVKKDEGVKIITLSDFLKQNTQKKDVNGVV